MPLTAEQLHERRDYIGGTDAAALAGVNPPGWAQPIDVYMDKVGLSEPRPPSAMMALGSRLEPVVADMFTDATGIRLRRWSRTVRSREYPWAGGHIDRWAGDGSVFEAKWAMGRDEWGEGLGVGTPEAPVIIPAQDDPTYAPRVPLRYAVQVQHYLAVTGRPLAYLAVLLGYGDFRWYALWRDDAVIAHLMELEERFWRENVLAGVPPAPDGSEGYGRYLRRRYGADDGVEAVATPEQQQLARQLREARDQRIAAAKAEAEAEQRLQASMGTTARLVGPGFSVSWATTKPRLRVRWAELVAEMLRSDAAAAGAEWPATKKAEADRVREFAREHGYADDEPGTRPFKVTFDSEEGA